MGLFKEHPLSHYHKAFRRYLTVKSRMDALESRRDGGSFGIGVASDPIAKRWQSMRYRLEVLESFLKGEAHPNPALAEWLSFRQMRDRAESNVWDLISRTKEPP